MMVVSHNPLRAAALLVLLALPPALQAAPPAASSTLAAPISLLCQHQADPLAVAEAHPGLSWALSASPSPSRTLALEAQGSHGLRQSAYQIEAALNPADLRAGRTLLWDSGKIPSPVEALPTATYAGPTPNPGQKIWWRVRVWDGAGHASPWSQPARWTAAPTWHAQWIAAQATDAAAGALPMPLFRKKISLPAPVRSAVLHISGLGQYEARINGARIGTSELAPGWSDYRKTVFYDSYDVTKMLQQGENALGVELGNGMFRVLRTPGRYTKLVGSFGPPELIAQLHIELGNGQTLDIATDPSWKTAPGPIVFTSIYGGEDYDARRELPSWDTASFDDAPWAAAVSVPGPTGQLQPELAPPSHVQRHYQPVQTTEPKPGVTVYDLGQNFAGWPAIIASGPAGSSVKLIPGELLNPDGTVSQRSSGKPEWFTYTLKGQGAKVQALERWHPQFSYYGFRYLQMETAGGAHVSSVEGQSVFSSSPPAGSFTSSSTQLNRIHQLILRAIENNTQSLLTDCPHREKLGWLEETHLLAPSILYDFDFQRLYAALARNMADAQKPTGAIPEIAPQYVVFDDKWGSFNDSPEWGSASVLAPWYLYQRTGDLDALLGQRQVMRRYVDYLTTRAEGGIIAYGLGDWYDIGPKPPGVSQLSTPGITATAIYFQDLTVLARVSALAGDQAASSQYATLAASVRAAFNSRFFDRAHHRYDTGSQTAQAMPLVLGLAPDAERAAVLQALIEDIHAHNDHVTAGDIGYHYVVDALLEAGRSNVLLAMLERTDAPSYGSQLAKGATALTEAWDANPASSQDHFMLGHAEEWFYRGLAGITIDLAAPPDGQLTIAPQIVGDVTSASASYNSAWGPVASSWQKSGNRVEYNVTVPINARATLRMATTQPSLATVNGAPPARAAGVLGLRTSPLGIELTVGSGSYRVVVSNEEKPQSIASHPQARAEQETR